MIFSFNQYHSECCLPTCLIWLGQNLAIAYCSYWFLTDILKMEFDLVRALIEGGLLWGTQPPSERSPYSHPLDQISSENNRHDDVPAQARWKNCNGHHMVCMQALCVDRIIGKWTCEAGLHFHQNNQTKIRKRNNLSLRQGQESTLSSAIIDNLFYTFAISKLFLPFSEVRKRRGIYKIKYVLPSLVNLNVE